MVEKILNIIKKILIIIIKSGIAVISTIVLLFVFIQLRPIYTDILYPNAYAKFFIKGDEKVVNAYKGEICLDTDIVSRTYKWKNITSTYPFLLNNKKSPNSLDCFTARGRNNGSYKEYIVRLKTDNKTINYIIRAHNRPEIALFGIDGNVEIQSFTKVTVKINDEETDSVSTDIITYDQGYYSYSDNLGISNIFSRSSATHLESIIIEGEYKGIKSAGDIIFNNLETGDYYICEDVASDDRYEQHFKEMDINFMKFPEISLVDGDNHFAISAIDKLGRKVYWSLIITKYSNDIFQSRLKLTPNSVDLKYHPKTITAEIDIKREGYEDTNVQLVRKNHDDTYSFIADMSPIKSDNDSDIVKYEAQFESDYEAEVYDVIAKIAQREVRFHTPYRVITTKDDIEFMSGLSKIVFIGNLR